MLDIFLYAGRAIMPLLLMMALGCGLRRAGGATIFPASSTASAFMCCCRCSCF